jgi:dihydroorotate dehydrogenase (NAD+) catalytic subunit
VGGVLLKIDLTVRIGTLELKNPVMTASGTFGYAEEYAGFMDLNRLGAIVVKGISVEPMEGNPPPRICETACGMLNAIGLQNVGLKKFLEEKLPFLRRLRTTVVVNIMGKEISEYVRLAEELDAAGIEAIEINVSCPNVKKGGLSFGTDRRVLEELVGKVRKAATHSILVTKLSPNVPSISDFSRAAEGAGSDAISLINTLPGMAVDIETWRPKLANVIGGLSGPAIKPVAVRMVWEASNAVGIPVIGIGGITCFRDAIEFLLAGATAVQIGTGNFMNPGATIGIIEGMGNYLAARNLLSVRDIIGKVDVTPRHCACD